MRANAEAVPLAIVAAVARNGVIGSNGGLAWRLSSDLKRFKALTWGKPLVMGRKTFESINRALPGRETIVVTRDGAFSPAGALVAPEPRGGARSRRGARPRDGRGRHYRRGRRRDLRADASPREPAPITEVALEAEGDVRFPPIDRSIWREVTRQRGERGPRDEADFEFVDYERKPKGRCALNRHPPQIVGVGALDLDGDDVAGAQRAPGGDVDGAVDFRRVALGPALGGSCAAFVDDDRQAACRLWRRGAARRSPVDVA